MIHEVMYRGTPVCGLSCTTFAGVAPPGMFSGSDSVENSAVHGDIDLGVMSRTPVRNLCFHHERRDLLRLRYNWRTTSVEQ